MASEQPLTIILIRHADRVLTEDDPVLSTAGRVRARLLARMLADAGVVGVYVTATRRSQQTGDPTAARAGVTATVYDSGAAGPLAATITTAHPSGTVLVVAHSNTVGDIAAAFGVSGVGPLADTWFDRLLVITRRPGGATLIRLRYGANTL